MTEGKMIKNRQMNMLIMIAIIVGICIPLFFTAVQIGVFAKEPVVEVRQEVTDESAPVLRVVIDDGFCPMSFYDADGNLSGLNVELITMVANQLGMRLEFECGDWLTCRQNLEEGKADVILGLETFSNMQHVLKTVPVTTDQLNIYGKNKIESIGALANKKVAVMARSVIMTMFDLQCEMKELQTIMETQAEEKGLTVFWDMTGICHNELIGSPLHMRRILLNLLSNAVKYNKKDGEIHLTVNEIMQNDKTALFEFKVADNGIGMSESFIEDKLFQPFVQGAGEARTKYQGTGLGMSIVQRIVREMTGSIEVESKEGEGTTFTVTLPFAIDRSENVPKTIEEQKPDISGRKILVVEDNDLNLEIAQFMLEEDKAVVEVARDGLQAVEAFKNSREGELEVILMDIMMPNMDGIEAAKTIRSLDRADAKSIPIIAMTANAFAEDMRKTKEAGMNEHLTKPVDGEKLLQVLYKYKKTGL